MDVTRSTTHEFWEQYLSRNPEALLRILGDLYEHTHGPKSRPENLQGLWDLVSPRFTTKPFGAAVEELLAGRSHRWLTTYVPVSRRKLDHLICGHRPGTGPVSVIDYADLAGSMALIESIAKALKVHPSYFAEWRYMWVISFMEYTFESQPNLTIPIFRKFAQAS